jgi:hypothetical protein
LLLFDTSCRFKQFEELSGMYKESFEKGRIAATNIVFAIWLADGININI